MSDYPVKIPIPNFNICLNLHKLVELYVPTFSPVTDEDYNTAYQREL